MINNSYNLSFNKQYLIALQKLKNKKSIIIRNKKVKEILNYSFCIKSYDNIIKLNEFETNINYAKEELRWYLSGNNDIKFSPLIYNTWKKYSDNGKTVNSNYGERIFGKHKIINFSQWNWIKDKLNEDKNSRQCVININSYFDKKNETLDLPCTVFCQILIRNNKLIWCTFMRSQDIYYGTRNDIYCFTNLQQLLAKELNVMCGYYYHHCVSLHIYQNQFDKLKSV